METITLSGQLFQYLITGITVGSVYAMVAVGFNIIYNVTEIINFAQGEFVMLGGLIMVFFHVVAGLPLIMAFPATVILVTLVGILLDRLAIRPIRRPSVLTLIIATIAASILIKGAAMFIWGKDPYDLPAFSGRNPITVFGAVIQPQYLWVIGFLIIIVIVLSIFFDRTIIGKAMSACADNPNAASLVGINVKQMILLSFALSAAIGAVAGITVTPISLMEYDRGAMLAVKGFGAAILGGLGSFPGAILGGLIMGSIESFGAGVISSGYKDAFALIVLLIVLFFRPSGILGSIEISKIKRF
ncbi:MAG: branched-chain amino acid ABC transporter permease [Desulfobacteraceae bacterium]|nr:branched-chain amino acid ABC transporter permease [Desulfobacteraceae bacterium]MDH3573253.1 branched-chain amino acid ABC transporter permease [Desulfobacteraceae bacterium]MDH3721205.1 branched-chain amino acid ABC transporter permease [Desulfobacteraceae bacterium]MDH3836397.1 branched-chain amino acid ABC transporter permease [Desulfobacteraceae bacterium]MDH3874231.1 branched-chain amino acid ABC transporter permease [Desulfobacteraceae bacterium]